MKFSELNLEDSVLQALDAMNFRECTPVQEHTIPVILEGKDLGVHVRQLPSRGCFHHQKGCPLL